MDTSLPRPDHLRDGSTEAASDVRAGTPIQFIVSDEFATLGEEAALQSPEELQIWQPLSQEQAPAGAPPYIAALYEIPLLTAEGEAFLFRKMNYLSYLAHRLQADSGAGTGPTLSRRIHELLVASEAVRNQIIESNLRLVVSIARKFAGARGNFDELVSEGNMILLKAVRKFDYSRGYRFSTYVTHAVQRHLSRHCKSGIRRSTREVAMAARVLDLCPGSRAAADGSAEAGVAASRMVARRIPECLSEREQYVIRERFGLGRGGITKTLQRVADEMGVCKERVRQIHHAALKKLKRLAEQVVPHVASA